jgi:hypothetical protein
MVYGHSYILVIHTHTIYTVYISIIVALAIILTIPTTTNLFASERADDLASMYKEDRPAINPDFAPDESCLFDIFQDKCAPGSQQECPEDFGTNEDLNCVPQINDGHRMCPDGYHTSDGDETGQCYPNSNGCSDANLTSEDRTSNFNFILLTGDDSPNPYDTCADPRSLCVDQPDHSGCKEYREWQNANN